MRIVIFRGVRQFYKTSPTEAGERNHSSKPTTKSCPLLFPMYKFKKQTGSFGTNYSFRERLRFEDGKRDFHHSVQICMQIQVSVGYYISIANKLREQNRPVFSRLVLNDSQFRRNCADSRRWISRIRKEILCTYLYVAAYLCVSDAATDVFNISWSVNKS